MENTCVCCGEEIPEGAHVCNFCRANIVYAKRNCPECGAPLKVYYDGPHSGNPEQILIRHCEKCLSDWESNWYGDDDESELRRKFWG